MRRHTFLLVSLIIPALGLAAQARAQEDSVAEFLSRCDTDQDYCQNEVSRIERMSNAIPGSSCPPESMSIDTMTSSVVGRLKLVVEENPEDNQAGADMAIEQVLPVLWPCH